VTVDQPLTVAELAALLRVSESWIQKRCAARAIPHTRVARQIRFTAEHVAQILAAGEEQPTVLPIRSRRRVA
jgi:excisionase family DNA binding protein